MELTVFNDKVFYFKNAIPNADDIIKYIESESNDLITEWLPWGNQYAKHLGIDLLENPRIPAPGYVIGRYASMQSRGLHTDCPYDDLENSFVIYYNDEYDGGDLIFPNYGLSIKPEAGSIVMFKSCDLDNEHEALPNVGVKYITPHFWRMGPSQGFVPWGSNRVEVPESITNDFHNLKAVEENKKRIFGK